MIRCVHDLPALASIALVLALPLAPTQEGIRAQSTTPKTDDPSSSLRGLVIASERIVEASVAKIRSIARSYPRMGTGSTQSFHVAELSVRSAFLGSVEERALYVVLPEDDDALRDVKVSDEPQLWFLSRSEYMFREGSAARDHVDKLLGDRDLFEIAVRHWAHFKISEDGTKRFVRVPENSLTLPAGLLKGPVIRTVPADPNRLVDCSRLYGSIRREVSETTPTIDAQVVSTGPLSNWTLHLGADRVCTIHSRGEKENRSLALSKGAFEAIVQTIERERFHELPRHVGWCAGPDDGFGMLTIRTTRGTKRVDIYEYLPKSGSAEETEPQLRAARIWSALPASDEEPAAHYRQPRKHP